MERNFYGIINYYSIKVKKVIYIKDDVNKAFFPLTDRTVEIDEQIIIEMLSKKEIKNESKRLNIFNQIVHLNMRICGI